MWGPVRFRQYMIRRQVAYQPGSRVQWADAGKTVQGIIRKVFTDVQTAAHDRQVLEALKALK